MPTDPTSPVQPPAQPSGGSPRGTATCRDCLAETVPANGRCRSCGSPRLLPHAERHALAIAHVDCDAFYAAVEKRDDPSLADKPVIIGGGRRGVVSTACYIARTYGVRSAMPMFQALKACPDAVVIRPRMEKYAEVGRQVRALMLGLTPLVEPVSIDEAFLDLAGTERLHGATPLVTLIRFARQVEEQLGITVSVGLSYNKFLAKVASDCDKPRGFTIIGRADAPAFLEPHPITLIPGVGAAAARRLEQHGLRTIADLRRVPPDKLFAMLGREGERLARLASGIDTRPVMPDRELKSVSSETTFETDVSDPERLAAILWRLSERVSLRLKRDGIGGATLTLNLKTADFRIRTRSRAIPATQLARRIFDPARELLALECDGTAFRLIGVGLSHLVPAAEADRGDLADQSVRREARAEQAIDGLRARFGQDAVFRGIALKDRRS